MNLFNKRRDDLMSQIKLTDEFYLEAADNGRSARIRMTEGQWIVLRRMTDHRGIDRFDVWPKVMMGGDVPLSHIKLVRQLVKLGGFMMPDDRRLRAGCEFILLRPR